MDVPHGLHATSLALWHPLFQGNEVPGATLLTVFEVECGGVGVWRCLNAVLCSSLAFLCDRKTSAL